LFSPQKRCNLEAIKKELQGPEILEENGIIFLRSEIEKNKKK